MRHTPGQWHVDTASFTIWAPGTPIVATVPLRDVSINEQKANAILIAKAPELLDVLSRLVHEAGYRLEQTGPLQRLHDEARALFAEIDAA